MGFWGFGVRATVKVTVWARMRAMSYFASCAQRAATHSAGLVRVRARVGLELGLGLELG